jgi:hypothetical protein
MKEQFTALHLAARCKVDLAGEDSSDEDVDYVDSPPSRSIVHYLVALPKVKVSESNIDALVFCFLIVFPSYSAQD